MRYVYYLNGAKITKKLLEDTYGKDRIKRITDEAREAWLEDPFIQNDFFMGNGMLTVQVFP